MAFSTIYTAWQRFYENITHALLYFFPKTAKKVILVRLSEPYPLIFIYLKPIIFGNVLMIHRLAFSLEL